jgi:hypothetical protein
MYDMDLGILHALVTLHATRLAILCEGETCGI